MTEKGSSFGMRVVMFLGGELAYNIFDRGCLYFEGCSEVIMYFLFFLLLLPYVHWSCEHLTYIVLIF